MSDATTLLTTLLTHLFTIQVIHVEAAIFRACNHPRGSHPPLDLGPANGSGSPLQSAECGKGAELLVHVPLWLSRERAHRYNSAHSVSTAGMD